MQNNHAKIVQENKEEILKQLEKIRAKRAREGMTNPVIYYATAKRKAARRGNPNPALEPTVIVMSASSICNLHKAAIQNAQRRGQFPIGYDFFEDRLQQLTDIVREDDFIDNRLLAASNLKGGASAFLAEVKAHLDSQIRSLMNAWTAVEAAGVVEQKEALATELEAEKAKLAEKEAELEKLRAQLTEQSSPEPKEETK